ncbi:WAT1-related protein At3g28050-like isoform X1 [Malania oleifera]|uniref:WAT1-related protein At3g28050-like isoform X1 n=1 Tax=Malania oleifera TaxID=397392 RepID=UPI0025ADCCAF|nr:WAT1-related protein At3g28050-like isoform X1 [Malania oleifera]
MTGSGVTAAMMAVECLEVGSHTLSKAAMSRGMSNFIFVLYDNALAALLLVPASFFFYWKRSRPPLSFSVVFKIFVLSVLSCPVQIFMSLGIRYSSPTLASAMTNLVPAFTFLLAVVSRMEKLDLRIQSSQAKTLGTIVSITGALAVSLYRGPPVAIFPPSSNCLHEHLVSSPSNWVIGGIFLAAGCFLLSLSYIVKTWVIRDYPEELMVIVIRCIFVVIQSALVALFAEKDPTAWRLRPGVELISIGYSAIFSTILRSVVHMWACRKKGPVYAAMFKPLRMVLATVAGIIFLGDTLHLGSLVGGAIIAVGFYSVVWGQHIEEKAVEVGALSGSESSSSKAPLLQIEDMEI